MPLSPRGRLAQLFFRHAVLTRLAPVTTHQLSIGRDRGPRPQGLGAVRRFALDVGMRWDGGGLHRRAGPGREQLSVRNRFLKMDVFPYTRQLNFNGAGWTPARPSAGGASESCLVPFRQGVKETVCPRTRAPSFDGAGGIAFDT